MTSPTVIYEGRTWYVTGRSETRVCIERADRGARWVDVEDVG